MLFTMFCITNAMKLQSLNRQTSKAVHVFSYCFSSKLINGFDNHFLIHKWKNEHQIPGKQSIYYVLNPQIKLPLNFSVWRIIVDPIQFSLNSISIVMITGI